ncbi:MAG: YceI family protein [Deltaproteobacteria bacterium]|nr:YceI family protein [Deltaproteobacteria bacterium]
MSTQTWNIDPSHSGVNFSVRHMMIAKVRGSFGAFSGAITVDDDDASKSLVKAEIDVASINTHEPKRDGHLKSPDFFDVEKFPKLTFVSKRVEGKGDSFKLVGDLTLHGVTKEVTLDVSREGGGKDPWGNQRLAFTARGSLNRTDYGLKWNQALEAGGVLVGEKVDIDLEVSAVLAK